MIKTLDDRQLAAVAHIRSMGTWLLLADVGTGKTVMVLTAYQQLRAEGRVSGGIVFAPLRVCRHVWPFEAEGWPHLRPAGGIASAAGLTPEKRRHVLEGDADLVCLNYEAIPWLVKTYPDGVPGRNVLIADEVDKLKAVTAKRWKALCGTKPAHGGWISRAGIVWRGGMTGTPRPNHYQDLYGQVVVADSRDRLVVEIDGVRSRSFYDWRTVHFNQNPWQAYAFDLKPGHAEGIEQQIAPITHRLAARPGIDVPHVRTLPARRVTLSPEARKIYKELEKEYIVLFRKKLDDVLTKVEVQHAGALYGKLRELGQGFIYTKTDNGTNEPEWVSESKNNELASLVSELQGTQAMIVYHFKAQRDHLVKQYPSTIMGVLGVSEAQDQRTIKQWNNGDLSLLAVHPQSAGHGLNLQHSGAHHIIMLTLPESAGQVKQVIGRLARRGTSADTVYVHSVATDGTVDADRQAIVDGKVVDERAMLARMEARNISH